MVGMALAVLATVLGPRVSSAGWPGSWAALVIGGGVGLYAAKVVKMTQMPELVALMHSLVGLAACLVGFASYVSIPHAAPGRGKTIHEVEIHVGIPIGAGHLSARSSPSASSAARSAASRSAARAPLAQPGGACSS